MGKTKKIPDKKLENTECRIDDKPPVLPVALVTKPRHVNQIAMDTRLLDLDNANLLHKLYKIHVTHGRTSTFRTKPIPMGRTNFAFRKREGLMIERDNRHLNFKLSHVKPMVATVETLAKEWEISKNDIKSRMKFPEFWGGKKGKDFVAVEPPLAGITEKRRSVRIDIFLNEHGYIGNFIIMLYNDYEPKLCQNFLRLTNRECACHCPCEALKINYIIPKFFCTIQGIEEDIITDDETPHVLHHGETGVLSTSRTTTNRFSFLITFRPLPCMDSKYIAFGKVVKGFKAVKGIETFGAKAGYPLKDLRLKIQEI